jgi:hypothetical protein
MVLVLVEEREDKRGFFKRRQKERKSVQEERQ